MTTIRYFIPEDGDSEQHPNVFLAPKPRQQGAPPTLAQVKEAFPLPGRYHFRFKSPLVPGADRDKGSMAVWMDCVNDSDLIPTWQGAVVAKVTRTSIEEDEDDDDEAEFAAARAASRTPAATAPPPLRTPAPPPSRSQSSSSEPLLDVFAEGGPAKSAATATSSVHSSTQSVGSGGGGGGATGNLLDVHAAAPPAPTSGGSLLDMETPIRNSSANSTHSDFLGMTAPATPAQRQPYPPANGYAPNHSGYGHARPTPQQHSMPPQQQQTPQQPYPPQQQQQQQQPQGASAQRGSNAFTNFSNNQGPFGGLEWK